MLRVFAHSGSNGGGSGGVGADTVAGTTSLHLSFTVFGISFHSANAIYSHKIPHAYDAFWRQP